MPMANNIHLRVDPDANITKLHPKILHELADYLNMPDGSSKPYWKALIEAIPGNLYSDMDINKISMESMRLNGGDSSLCLLRDLGNRRGKTVKQLASYLEKLHYEQPLALIKSQEPLAITHQPVSASVVDGTVARVGCKARGFPYPRYQWYRAFIEKDGEIRHDMVSDGVDSFLELDPVSLYDAGGYCCKVYHKYNGKTNEKFTEWAYLTVLSAPGSPKPDASGQIYSQPVIHEQPKASLAVNLGQELTLTCRASGCPQPTYQWYRMEEDTKTGSFEKKPLKGYTSDVLQFAQAQMSDSGQYMCCAQNSKGQEWSVTAAVTVETLAQKLRRRHRIEIVRQPMSVDGFPNMPQTLECLASCSSSKLFYQWYKDGEEISGEMSSQLCFSCLQGSNTGRYSCRVSAENGQYEESQVAQLQVRLIVERRPYFAVDKVALLIGNEEYRSGDALVAPGNDMHKLAEKLSNEPLDFKVVSLLDLTLVEMRKALDIFTCLLNEGVYGLFYFSGHGFEHDGQSYMVPNDAPSGYLPADCMCAQEVLDKMQGRKTALNVIFLDICRKFNDFAQGPATRYKPTVKGNTVYGYAAQCNSEAYEVKSAGYAIFSRYLSKRIHEDEPIMVLLSRVLEDVKRDEDARNRQFPAVTYDLNESRSLADPISYRGYTREFNNRQDAWERAHGLSQDMVVPFSLGVQVAVQFDSRFSNQMHIKVHVSDRGSTNHCIAEVHHFPPVLDIKVVEHDVVVPVPGGRSEIRKLRITKVKNVQRLRDDLKFRLKVRYFHQGQEGTEEVEIPVGRPLIADVWIMDSQLERGPIECDDYPDSTTMTTPSMTSTASANSLL